MSQNIIKTTVFNNALPFHADRIELTLFLQQMEAYLPKFQEKLVDGTLNDQIKVSSAVHEKLLHLYFESRNIERITGDNPFALGFPMLFTPEPNQLGIYPMFLWPLKIEPAAHPLESWIIKSNGPPIANPFCPGQLPKKVDELTILETATAEGWTILDRGIAIAPFPGMEQFGEYEQTSTLIPAGIISLFEINNLPSTQENIGTTVPFPLGEMDKKPTINFSMQSLSPFQENALQTVLHNKTTVITGPAGVGKLETVAQVIISGLLNIKKTLVVSDRIPPLKRLQQHIDDAQLPDFTYRFQDGELNTASFIGNLHTNATLSEKNLVFSRDDFSKELSKTKRIKDKVDHAYHAVTQPLFGPANWAELVGMYLNSQRIEGKEALATQLAHYDFDFTFEEYHAIKRFVLHGQTFIDPLPSMQHPLSVLHPSNFDFQDGKDAHQQLMSKLEGMIQKFYMLNGRWLEQLDELHHQLTKHYEQNEQKLRLQAQQINDKIIEFKERFGVAGMSGHLFSGLYERISGKHKSEGDLRREIFKDFQALKATHDVQPPFDMPAIDEKEARDLHVVQNAVETYISKLIVWENQIPRIVQDEFQRLNGKSLHVALQSPQLLKDKEEQMDHLFEALSNAEIFEQSPSNNMLTMPMRHKLIEQTLDRLEHLHLNMRDFHHFFPWHKNWLAADEKGKKVLKALARARSQNWVSAFESWFFYQALIKHDKIGIPHRSFSLENLLSQMQKVRKEFPLYIRDEWHKMQQDRIKNTKGFKAFIDKARKRTPDDLMEALHPFHYTWQEFFPVMMVHSADLQHMDAKQLKAYDQIILLESVQFDSQIAQSLVEIDAPQYVVVQLANAQNGQSLSTQLLQDGVPHCPIYNQNQQNYPWKWIHNFSMVVVKGKMELQHHTNALEMHHVIDELMSITPGNSSIYPEIAIVTNTKAQRNQIAFQLLQLKNAGGKKGDKIGQMERNGLGIYHVSELDGIFPEVVIGSMVYEECINNEENSALDTMWRQLIQRPLQQLIVVTSTVQEKAKSSVGWTKAMFEIHAATTAGQWKTAEQTLQNLKPSDNNEFIEPAIQTSSTFDEELKHHLHQYLPDLKWQYLQDGQWTKLISQADTNFGIFLLKVDGFFGKLPYPAYQWEQNLQDYAESQQKKVKDIWSRNWWKDHHIEGRALVSTLIAQQKPETENEEEE